MSGFTEQGVGWSRTDTSADAAAKLAGGVRHKRLIVLREILRQPSTADEIGARLGWVRMSVQPRCSDLRRLGKIEDSGLRRRNVSGRDAIVWIAKGEAA